MYDVTDRETFENVSQWMHEIERFANDNVCKVLVANKIDLESQRKVSREEGEELAKHYNIPYIETSAKNNICVEESFITMAKQIKQSLLNKGQFSTSASLNAGKYNGYGKGTRLHQPTPQSEEDPKMPKSKSAAGGGCC